MDHLQNNNKIPESILCDFNDWISINSIKQAYANKTNHVVFEKRWAFDGDLVEFCQNFGYHHLFRSTHSVYLLFDGGFARISRQTKIIVVTFYGEISIINELITKFNDVLSANPVNVEWYFKSTGGVSSTTMPLRYRPAHDSHYPWLKVPMKVYFQNFLKSSANILILIGPPGTGKTAFIENLIHFSGKNACVTYDEQVMNDDNLFQQFLESDANTMIFEDSDNHIRPRQDGNSMMHKFLNVSDGIISSSDKKLIFSTNLPSSNNIDEALLRPGRCFDIMNFRALNRVEAEKVCKDIGRVLPDGNEFFLTNLFNGAMPSEQVITKMGF
jgi:hypothetical protein